MRIAVVGHKGGAGKTVVSVHLAGVLSQRGPTLLVDGDLNRTALTWAQRGGGRLPFQVVAAEESARHVGGVENIVIDTAARLAPADLQELEQGCDWLVLPTSPDVLSLDGLLATLGELKTQRYAILLNAVPPPPSKAGEEMAAELKQAGWRVFKHSLRRLSVYPQAALLGCLVRDVSGPRAAAAWGECVSVGKELSKWASSQGR